MAMIFIIDEMYVIQLSASVLKNLEILFSGSVVTNDLMLKILRKRGLYATNASDIRKAMKKSITNADSPSLLDCDDPRANASYFSTRLSTGEEAVKFWHINLGHPSKLVLQNIIRHKLIDGIPLTEQQVKDNWTDCPDCPFGNMSQKRHPKEADREYVTGKTMSIDAFVAGGTMASPHLTHSGEGYAILCCGRGSGKSWSWLTKSISELVEYIIRMDRI